MEMAIWWTSSRKPFRLVHEIHRNGIFRWRCNVHSTSVCVGHIGHAYHCFNVVFSFVSGMCSCVDKTGDVDRHWQTWNWPWSRPDHIEIHRFGTPNGSVFHTKTFFVVCRASGASVEGGECRFAHGNFAQRRIDQKALWTYWELEIDVGRESTGSWNGAECSAAGRWWRTTRWPNAWRSGWHASDADGWHGGWHERNAWNAGYARYVWHEYAAGHESTGWPHGTAYGRQAKCNAGMFDILD